MVLLQHVRVGRLSSANTDARFQTVRIARRFLGIALQCALLTMSLVGSGYACGDDEKDAMQGSMAGMADMPGMPMPASSDGDSDNSSPQPDCSLPWAPGACHQMASCSPNAVTAPANVIISAPTSDHSGPAKREIELRSVTRSPEPPPPRA